MVIYWRITLLANPMLIYDGNKIRLTREELAFFYSETGRSRPPRTVEEYNQAFEEAAASCEADGSPEGRLLAAILRDHKIQQASGQELGFASPYLAGRQKFPQFSDASILTEEDCEFFRSLLIEGPK